MNFLQPDPVLLWFLFFKAFIYLEVLAVLALIRVLRDPGPARWPALAALVLALAGLAVIFAPAAGLNSGPLYLRADGLMRHGGGLTALLFPSAFFVLSGFLKTSRKRWLDAAHTLLLLTLLGFAWYAS
ncbi:hypothetical protein [Tropicibacter sp. S64]|uniref:hypothetical protein n=1 Tax=Tropicibacter sp. S64 TaxID=3415122 RepID=UPI003C7EAF1F